MPKQTGAPDRKRGIDLEIHPRFQRREWAAQRLGWIVMFGLLAAGMAGAFGRGPLASASAGEAGDPLRLDYERTVRHRAPTTLRVHLAPGAARDGRVRLGVSRDYLRAMELTRAVPEPEAVEAAGEDYVFTFRVTDPERSSTIVLDLEPESYGTMEGRIGLPDAPAVRFRHFVFP